MAITINGTGSITGLTAGGLPDGSITSADLASGAITSGSLPAGSVLQVKQTVKTDSTSTTNQDSFTDTTGMSVAITPASTSNKVLVSVSIGRVNNSSTSIRLAAFRLMRDSTAIGVGSTAGSRLAATFLITDITDSNYGQNGCYQFLDSPSTTSEVTYKLQWTGQAGETVYLNRSTNDTDSSDAIYSRTASTITVMEVAG